MPEETMGRSLSSLLLVAALAAPVQAADTTKILMFVRDGARDLALMLDKETGVMKQMLEDAGIEVVVATTTGAPMTSGDSVLEADLKISDARASDYDGFILPCMAPAPGSPLPDEVVTLIEEASRSGKPIAASRGSVAILGEAGALEGREYSYAQEVDVNERPEFKGGTYKGTGYTQDGNITTVGICPLASRSLNLPDGTEDLTRGFIASLKKEE
jgi:putative intracellular protease/amidase